MRWQQRCIWYVWCMSHVTYKWVMSRMRELCLVTCVHDAVTRAGRRSHDSWGVMTHEESWLIRSHDSYVWDIFLVRIRHVLYVRITPRIHGATGWLWLVGSTKLQVSFCRIYSLLLGSFAREIHNLIDLTNRRHPILMCVVCVSVLSSLCVCAGVCVCCVILRVRVVWGCVCAQVCVRYIGVSCILCVCVYACKCMCVCTNCVWVPSDCVCGK